VTFVDWDDMHKWSLINRALEMGIPEPTETYSSSPHLYTDLDIPEGTKGRIPGSVPKVREAAPAATGGRPPRSGAGTSSRDGNRPPRERAPRTDAVRDSAEGGGTHDGASPTRRRRTRTRRGGQGAPGGNTPPAS